MLQKDNIYLGQLYSIKAKNILLKSSCYIIELPFLVNKKESLFRIPAYFLSNNSNSTLRQPKSSLCSRRFSSTDDVAIYLKKKVNHKSIVFIKLNNLCFTDPVVFNSFLFYCFENVFSLFLKITIANDISISTI